MPTPSAAVFLSYASEDASAARRIAEALRAGGIEVWFDQSELRGGDAWDRQIRKQIHDCCLFLAVISAHSEARDEGYFRREWKLAVDRTHDMVETRAFLVPVVIDGTSERGASVPDKFRELQWTRLVGGETSPDFVERVQRLLSTQQPHTPTIKQPLFDPPRTAIPSGKTSAGVRWPAKRVLPAVLGVLVLGAVAYLASVWVSRRPASPQAPSNVPGETTSTSFNPPPHSIAVLPFVNMGGDKDQEYFSEGLTEELLNSLARINELQVAARTSSFSFQGAHPDISTVAHKLNVGAVLEGSVRHAGHRVRIATQLVNGVTGFQLWSQSYDRDLGDVLKLQSDIATSVAGALKLTLLRDDVAKIEAGGTRNAAAFDAYLRASKEQAAMTDEDLPLAIKDYTEAIRLDPAFALAYAGRSIALSVFAYNEAKNSSELQDSLNKARDDAKKAISLSPTAGLSHLALALAYEGLLEFKQANDEYERALVLEPGNARILKESGVFAALMGHADSGLLALRRAVTLDPLGKSHYGLGWALTFLGRHEHEAIAAFRDHQVIAPGDPWASGFIGINYYLLGDSKSALAACENKSEDYISQMCRAMTYNKVGRRADAEATFAKMLASTNGGARPLLCASVNAQWGNTDRALEYLETGLRLRDPQAELFKVDPLIDPLRSDPRFQAIVRALKFPD